MAGDVGEMGISGGEWGSDGLMWWVGWRKGGNGIGGDWASGGYCIYGRRHSGMAGGWRRESEWGEMDDTWG